MLRRSASARSRGFVIGGSALLFAQFMPTRRPLRTGGLCLFAAVTLALAAGTLGISSGTPADASVRAVAARLFCRSHGGILGQGLYWAAHRLVQTVGVDILVVFLLVVGVVLLTGLRWRWSCARRAMAWSTPVACCVPGQAPLNAQQVSWRRALQARASRFARVRGALAAAARACARGADRARHPCGGPFGRRCCARGRGIGAVGCRCRGRDGAERSQRTSTIPKPRRRTRTDRLRPSTFAPRRSRSDEEDEVPAGADR